MRKFNFAHQGKWATASEDRAFIEFDDVIYVWRCKDKRAIFFPKGYKKLITDADQHLQKLKLLKQQIEARRLEKLKLKPVFFTDTKEELILRKPYRGELKLWSVRYGLVVATMRTSRGLLIIPGKDHADSVIIALAWAKKVIVKSKNKNHQTLVNEIADDFSRTRALQNSNW